MGTASTNPWRHALALLWCVLSTSAAEALSSQSDAQALAEFNRRLGTYVELRDQLSTGIPTPSDSATPEEIITSERMLADRMRSARATAKHRDIFTPAIEAMFRRVLQSELQGRRGVNTRGIIMDENPGRLAFDVNGTYPKHKPLSTVPPNVLRRLPTLPPDLEYRFIDRHLILRDARTNLVVDYILNALPSK